MANISPLRPITHKLTTTPLKDLLHIAPLLASSLANYLENVQNASRESSALVGENSVLLHKLRTRISSLLQDRAPEGRIIAVLLVKAYVETGGREALSSSESWTRGLISLLSKKDPPSAKKLCIFTVTRIFLLTQQFPTLVREITTPLLPSFLTACLNLIKPIPVITEDGTKTSILSPMLEPVLHCFNVLLPRHPTTFRPFTTRIQPIVLSLLGHKTTPSAIVEIGGDLFVALHSSSPKNTAATEWSQSLHKLVSVCHATISQVFRAVIENWEPSDQLQNRNTGPQNFDQPAGLKDPDGLGLDSWEGIDSGTRRITLLLRLLTKMFSSQTPESAMMPVGLVIDLSTRLTSVTISGTQESPFSVRLNPEVGRDEREQLWLELPRVHVTVLDLFRALVRSISKAAISCYRSILEQVIRIWDAEANGKEVRVASYEILGQLLPHLGTSCTKADMASLTAIVRMCCSDSLSRTEASVEHDSKGQKGITKDKPSLGSSVDADTFLTKTKTANHTKQVEVNMGVQSAARQLLPLFTCHIPADVIPYALRTELDRTAILIQHQRAMFASILNPPPAKGGQLQPSIIPFFARHSNQDLEMEAVLRPRMPVVRQLDLRNAPEEHSEDEESDNDHQEVSETPNGMDLLDRLEHSLNSGQIDTNNIPVKSSAYPAVPAKRTWDSSAGSVIELEPSVGRDPLISQKIGECGEFPLTSQEPEYDNPPTSSHLDTVKRRRLEYQEHEPGTTASTEPSTFSDTVRHKPGTYESVELSRTEAQHPQEPVASSFETGLIDAGDSDSDFEIPPINPDPDTEDEDQEIE